MKVRLPAFRVPCLCIISLSFSASLPARADDGTWTGNGTTSNWSDTANWANSTPAQGVDATAGINSGYVNLDGQFTVGSLNIGGYLSAASPGSSLTLATSIGAPIVTVGDGLAAYLDVAIDGNQGFVKNGLGSLWLRGNNSYSGQTVVESGTLYVWRPTFDLNGPAPRPLGATGTENGTTVEDGATLVLGSSIVGESLTISGNGNGNGALVGSRSFSWYEGFRQWGGDVTLAADAKIGAMVSGNVMLAGNTLTLGNSEISGNISGTGNVLVDGDAWLSGNANYSGMTRVLSDGRLTVERASVFTGASGTAWTKENTTIESDGTLLLRLGGGSAFTADQAAAVIQGLSININQNGLKAGSSIGFDTPTPLDVFGWNPHPVDPITYSHAIGDSTGEGGGSLGVVKQGGGALILTGANSYTGKTDIFRGQLVFSGASALYGGDQASWAKEKISVHDGGDLVLGVGGASGFTTSQVASIFSELSSGISQNGLMAGSNFGIDTSAATGTVTYDAAITDSTGAGAGAVGFTKMGNGKLILSGNNSYSGGVSILGGTLQLGSNQALGQSSSVFLAGKGSKLNLGSQTITLDGLSLDGDLGTAQSVSDVISVSNGTIVLAEGATAFVRDAAISANLTGAGGLHLESYSSGIYEEVYNERIRGAYVSGINSYTGQTSIAGYAYFTRPEALYAGDVSKWNSNYIGVRNWRDSGELALGMGGGGFSGEQASALLNGLRQRAEGYTIGGFGLDEGAGLSLDVTGDETLNIVASEMDTEYESGMLLTKKGSGSLTVNAARGLNSAFRIYEGKLILGASIGGNPESPADWYISSGASLDLNGNNLQTASLEGFNTYNDQGALVGVHNSKVGTVSVISLHGQSGYTLDSEIYAESNFDDFGNIVRGEVAVEKTGSSAITFSGSGLSRIAAKEGQIEIQSASADVLSIDGGKAIVSGNFYGNAVVGTGQLIVGSSGGSQPFVWGGEGNVLGHVLVTNGGTLGGHGNVVINPYAVDFSGAEAVMVASGGTLAPGTSIGSLKSYGGVNFASNSTYQYEVDSAAVLAAGADLLVILGDLNLSLTQLAFANIAETPQSFEIGTMFSLMNYTGSWNGGLFVLGGNVLENGEEFYAGQNYWRIDYDSELGGLNFDSDHMVSESSRFINITATAVPEPSSMLLGAVASLLLFRRRR